MQTQASRSDRILCFVRPEDWSYRHTGFFLPLFSFVGLGIARRRYR